MINQIFYNHHQSKKENPYGTANLIDPRAGHILLTRDEIPGTHNPKISNPGGVEQFTNE